jgi:hypothetical protein
MSKSSAVTCITIHVVTNLEEIDGGFRFDLKEPSMSVDTILFGGEQITEEQRVAISAGLKLVILSTAAKQVEADIKEKRGGTAVEVTGDDEGNVKLN